MLSTSYVAGCAKEGQRPYPLNDVFLLLYLWAFPSLVKPTRDLLLYQRGQQSTGSMVPWRL